MFCSVCGYNLTGNEGICPVCGNKVIQYNQAPQQPQQYNQAPQQPQQQHNQAPPQPQQYNQAPPQPQQQYNQAPPQQQPQQYNQAPQQQPQQQYRPQQMPQQQYVQPGQPPKKGSGNLPIVIISVALGVLLIAGGILLAILLKKDKGGTSQTGGTTTESAAASTEDSTDATEASTEVSGLPTTEEGGGTTENPGADIKAEDVVYLQRPSILNDNMVIDYAAVQPAVPAQTVEADLSDVEFNDYVAYMPDETKARLAQNQFLVVDGYDREFYEGYEFNRYDVRPNFVTVDSIMHTYHLYFAYVLKNTETKYLSAELAALGQVMQDRSMEQYNALKGTEWETAARTNLAFFAIGNSLLNPGAKIPSDVNDTVNAELTLIEAADSIEMSPLFNDPDNKEDYTQYIPRGYYDKTEELKRYFKAMMWYGRRNFAQANEDQDRSALLMTLALDGEPLARWEKIYTVTSFFAGASDDSGYYEYRPIIDAAYGSDVTVEKLIGDTAGWETFHRLTGEIDPPKINSVVVYASDSDEEAKAKIVGFRFMGQRFSIDATVFQNLCFRQTQENSAGEYRMLPNALDIPAAMGSDTALSILQSKGETDYRNYNENMTKMREMIQQAPEETWNASLYSQWLNTLRPLLEVKGEGYPTYMQTEEWRKKNLTTFLGSYTELKHDTILYSKQMMAEMGGDVPPERDDRGYVEAEPEVYARLTALVNATSAGLDQYGMLSDADRENLKLLADITIKLQTISEKELRDELPTDEEFDFIRSYGGQLEHFWQEVNKDEAENEYFTSEEFPAAIVADVATDPNGTCLELGTGKINDIYVIVTVDGVKKIAFGGVYSFYQFDQPISDRLTDSKWRQMLGIELQDDGTYNYDKENQPKQEDWTDSYRYSYD